MPTTLPAKSALRTLDDLSAIDGPEILRSTAEHGFTILRGLIDPLAVDAAVATIRSRFDASLDHPASGQAPSAIHDNFQKLTIGGESRSASHDDARFFRTFYNPLWADDVWGMREVFARLAQVRNRVAGLPDEYALSRVEDDGLWTAARFHQYPRGGGFFRRHTDHVTSRIAGMAAIRYVQIVLCMSRKGRDFEDGGAFVDHAGARICLDDFAVPGDVLVYDGRTVHGVEDVDPCVPLDLSTVEGRLAGFVTLYERL